MMLLHGDCLERLRELPDCSVDACVTDPPYGLSFMGKAWDYDVPQAEVWREVLRVLKPGGHLLAFAGTRTQHRMAVQIEDAGFEIRDLIAWVYGSGFPKSLDVSKAIDKRGGDPLAWQAFSKAYSSAVAGSQFTHADIDRALGIKSSSCYWARTDHRGGMPPRHHWEAVRKLLQVPDEFARLYDEAEREVVGQKTAGIANPGDRDRHTIGASKAVLVDITAPATPAAQQWQGWGTALKPALEPITVARKPLVGTVAENVLQHGTGGINVDGCRVAAEGESFDHLKGRPLMKINNRRTDEESLNGPAQQAALAKLKELGRWPANLIHDGSEEPCALLGDAARFFYCAKASKADRGAENVHPTVKPTDLMRYLVRLVTPPSGVVLDPFMGSGSTGKAAVLEGFRFIGIEREAEYIEIARGRIQVPEQTQGSLL